MRPLNLGGLARESSFFKDAGNAAAAALRARLSPAELAAAKQAAAAAAAAAPAPTVDALAEVSAHRVYTPTRAVPVVSAARGGDAPSVAAAAAAAAGALGASLAPPPPSLAIARATHHTLLRGRYAFVRDARRRAAAAREAAAAAGSGPAGTVVEAGRPTAVSRQQALAREAAVGGVAALAVASAAVSVVGAAVVGYLALSPGAVDRLADRAVAARRRLEAGAVGELVAAVRERQATGGMVSPETAGLLRRLFTGSTGVSSMEERATTSVATGSGVGRAGGGDGGGGRGGFRSSA
ncbi:hypothetical protein MMPV_001506 [Pyropia vietnamensis]